MHWALVTIRKSLFVLLGILGVLGLAACGGDSAGGGGGGQCGDVEESGICLFVTQIDPLNLDNEFTQDVDVNFVADCDGDPATFDPEDFTEHFADVTLSASFVGPVNATLVTVTSMTVTFAQNTTDPPVTCTAGPFVPNCSPVPAAGPLIAQLTTGVNIQITIGSSTTSTVSLMNFQRKDDYTPAAGFDIFTDGPFDPTLGAAFLSYTVTYTFSGVDDFGRDVSARGSTEVIIGAYSNC